MRTIAQAQRRCASHLTWLASTALASVILQIAPLPAVAQNAPPPEPAPDTQPPSDTVTLPTVSVTSTRLVPGPRPPARSNRGAPGSTTAPAPAPTTGPATGEGTGTGTGETVTAGIVSGTVLTGASTTIITAADIARSPGATLQDILAREPGIQVTSLFGAVNGTRTTVDLRGFGATASSNTLLLINGRRLNDIDLAGVDYSTIPRDSIERIEVTRGNSGAVLYGDGAVGGVINIITKAGADLPPSVRLQGTVGSYNYTDGSFSASGSQGPFSGSVYTNTISSHGYRDNNQLHQNNGTANFGWTDRQGTTAYLNLAADDQHLGLPGGRRVTPTTSEVVTDPRGAATPFDFGNTQGVSATSGITRELFAGTTLIVDGGVRQKNQQAQFFVTGAPDFDSSFKATLTNFSLTPRVTSQHYFGGMSGKLIAGVDYYDTLYDSDRGLHLSTPPIHHYNLTQQTLGGYYQETLGLLPTTDFAVGTRIQSNNTTARDQVNFDAPGAAAQFPIQGLPFNQSETQWAQHFGLEHRFNDTFALFGRAAHSFRLPTVDERVGMAPFGTPTNFSLKTQTSDDAEAGARLTYGNFTMQSSAYGMDLNNELFFSPATFTNINLDPTRRYGVENIAGWQATETVRFKAGLAYTRAVFREGPFAGNDVPLVSRWTGNVGVSWDIYRKLLVFDGVVRFFGPKRMDNDSANQQVLIPGQSLVDVRIGGQYQQFIWSLSVQNLFNVHYFEYAISSLDFLTGLPSFGTYNAYPLPGRVVQLKGGLTW